MNLLNIVLVFMITARSDHSIAAPNKVSILDNNLMSANTKKEFLNLNDFQK